jgi:hypothetical protein
MVIVPPEFAGRIMVNPPSHSQGYDALTTKMSSSTLILLNTGVDATVVR